MTEEPLLLGPFWWAVEREVIVRNKFTTYAELVDWERKRGIL